MKDKRKKEVQSSVTISEDMKKAFASTSCSLERNLAYLRAHAKIHENRDHSNDEPTLMDLNPTDEEMTEVQKRIEYNAFRFYGSGCKDFPRLTAKEYDAVAYLKQIREEKAGHFEAAKLPPVKYTPLGKPFPLFEPELFPTSRVFSDEMLPKKETN